MLVMGIVLVFIGCNNDKDEPTKGEKLASKIAGNFYWGYGEEGLVSNASDNYFELSVNESGETAVLTGEGEVPLTLNFTFDKNGDVTVSAKKHDLWGTISGVEINDDGSEIRISGTSECTDRNREGDYVIVLKKQNGSRSEYWASQVRGNTYVWTNPEIYGFLGEESILVFDDNNKVLLTSAGECPMTINWTVDAWNNFDMHGENVLWTRENGG